MIDLIIKEKLKNITEDELISVIKKIADRSYHKGYVNGYSTGWDDHEPDYNLREKKARSEGYNEGFVKATKKSKRELL